jgi:hypothetical protein
MNGRDQPDAHECQLQKLQFLLGVLFSSGCVTSGPEYVRASGRTNPQRLQLALAEYQGEAATTPQDLWVEGFGVAGLAGNLMLRGAQVDTVTSACMARHG